MAKEQRNGCVPSCSPTCCGITFLFQQIPFTAQAVTDAGIDQMGDNRPYTEIGWLGMLQRWLLAPPAYQLWFIRVLLIYNIMYPLLRWLVIKIPRVWFIIISLLWLAMANVYFLEAEGLLFFTLGIWLCKKEKPIDVLPRWLNLRLTWAVFIGLALLKTWLAFALPFQFYSGIILLILHKTVVFTGLLAFWYGADALVKYCMGKPWFNWSSGFSFMIYALHVPLLCYAMAAATRYTAGFAYHRMLNYIVVPLLIILFCIAVGALLRKTLPSVYRLLTGNRGQQ
jgi:hypothetical protein